MKEAGRLAGRRRDEAGRSPIVRYDARSDGKVPALLSERTTVFVEAPANGVRPDDADVIDPAVYGEVPATWTWDLVLCRLHVVEALSRRLPPVKRPAQLKSFLGAFQPDQPSTASRPLRPAEDALFDWTWKRLQALSEVDRAVLMGMMCSYKLSFILKVTKALFARGIGVDAPCLSKTALHRRYRKLCDQLAGEWQAAGQPIDALTAAAWVDRMKKQ